MLGREGFLENTVKEKKGGGGEDVYKKKGGPGEKQTPNFPPNTLTPLGEGFPQGHLKGPHPKTEFLKKKVRRNLPN